MSTPETIRKHPDEDLQISVDFTYRLAAGEAISTATAATVGAGTIVTGASPDVASPIITVDVSGGTDGVTDSFEAQAVTDTGEIARRRRGHRRRRQGLLSGMTPRA